MEHFERGALCGHAADFGRRRLHIAPASTVVRLPQANRGQYRRHRVAAGEVVRARAEIFEVRGKVRREIRGCGHRRQCGSFSSVLTFIVK